ncbi:MAG: hypothetical protein HYY78_04900 [Betaproteobacteria bacterium]|nr:hypothetical protein [Betaproteobacteria bacterium]
MTVHRDSEFRDAEQRWLDGASALPVVTLLLARGASVQAAAVARLALARPDCKGAKATYFGLAAEAAFLAGDMLGTARLMRESMAHENEWCLALPQVFFIRERASSGQNELLDRAGIPLS